MSSDTFVMLYRHISHGRLEYKLCQLRMVPTYKIYNGHQKNRDQAYRIRATRMVQQKELLLWGWICLYKNTEDYDDRDDSSFNIVPGNYTTYYNPAVDLNLSYVLTLCEGNIYNITHNYALFDPILVIELLQYRIAAPNIILLCSLLIF